MGVARFTAADLRRLPKAIRSQLGPAQEPKKHKFGARAVVVDGLRYPSEKEAKRHQELKILERLGRIDDLDHQRVYVFEHNEVFIGKYVADFVYYQNKKFVVEDVKPFDRRTGKFRLSKEYRLKKALMKAHYGIEIQEV